MQTLDGGIQDLPYTVQQFEGRHEGIEYGYLIAVFVESGRIVTAEFVAPRALYDEHIGDILEMLPTIEA